jgi:hypothetical protein
MFDHVEFEAPCPTCGVAIRNWQSKDGPCLLETLKPWQVTRFYQACRECGSWVEYRRPEMQEAAPEPPGWREWFTQTVRVPKAKP